MATAPRISARDPHRALGSSELPFARLGLFALLAIPIGALFFLLSTSSEPSPLAHQVANFDPRSLVKDESNRGFLPPPVAAIPADKDAGPPVPAAGEAAQQGSQDLVKIANTGGVGAVLRAEPPRGSQVAALRDGQVLEVVERRTVDGDEWLRIKTKEGAEGWVYGRLVGPAG